MKSNIYLSAVFFSDIFFFCWCVICGSSLLPWPLLPQVLMEAWEKGVNPERNSTNPSNWDFSNSFFFAGAVVTTIGEVLSFLINWGFLQLSCKSLRKIKWVYRIHLQDNLDSCRLYFLKCFRQYLFLCFHHIKPAKMAKCLFGICDMTVYILRSLWSTQLHSLPNQTYGKSWHLFRMAFSTLNVLLAVVNVQGSIISYSNM